MCGRAKTEVFENDYVTGIGMSQSENKTNVFLSVFGGQVWTVENAAKTLVWTKIFLSVFKKQKTEVFVNALVWTGPQNPKETEGRESAESVDNSKRATKQATIILDLLLLVTRYDSFKMLAASDVSGLLFAAVTCFKNKESPSSLVVLKLRQLSTTLARRLKRALNKFVFITKVLQIGLNIFVQIIYVRRLNLADAIARCRVEFSINFHA